MWLRASAPAFHSSPLRTRRISVSDTRSSRASDSAERSEAPIIATFSQVRPGVLSLDQVRGLQERGQLLDLEGRAVRALCLRRRRLGVGHLVVSSPRLRASRSTRSAVCNALRIEEFDTLRRRAS